MKAKIIFFFLLFLILTAFLSNLNKREAQAMSLDLDCLVPSCFPIDLPEIPLLPCCPTSYPSPTSQPEPTPTGFVPGEPTATPVPPQDGGGDSQGGGGDPGPSHCGSQTPTAPYLRSLIKVKFGEVELLWEPVALATHYTISYGPSSGNYLYGVANTGKVTSFRVASLGSTNYCFSIRAVNDCAPSDPSNELCTGGQVLGAQVLGATGSFNLSLWQGLVIIAVICGAGGVKNQFLNRKRV